MFLRFRLNTRQYRNKITCQNQSFLYQQKPEDENEQKLDNNDQSKRFKIQKIEGNNTFKFVKEQRIERSEEQRTENPEEQKTESIEEQKTENTEKQNI